MPIYEYRCGACGFQKEFLQRINAAPLTRCPECGKRTFNKVVTAAAFQLKGTGWYATDFRNKGTKPAATKEKSESKPDKPADSSGKDPSKPAAACGAGACPACS
jgi:putative FmdB family regulatory protein